MPLPPPYSPILSPTTRVVFTQGAVAETLTQAVSSHRCAKSIMSSSGTLDLVLAQSGGVSPSTVIQGFIDAPAHDKPDVKVELYLGYLGQGDARVFSGWVQSAWTRALGQVLYVRALDDKQIYNYFYDYYDADRTVEHIVSLIVVALNLPLAKTVGGKSSLDLPDKKLRHAVYNEYATAREFLQTLKNRARIAFPWHFDADGCFWWRPWQADLNDLAANDWYVFDFPGYISAFRPIETDLNVEEEYYEKPLDPYPALIGPVYEMETPPMPWIRAGQIIQINGHPDSGKTIYCRVDSLVHRSIGNIYSRSILTLRGYIWES